MLTLIAAAALTIQASDQPACRFEYDKVKDVSRVIVDLGLVLVEDEHAAGLALGYQWDGQTRGPVPAQAEVALFLYSASEYWTFLKNDSMSILADETRIRPKAVDRERRVHFKIDGVPVTEQILYRISFGDLTAIGQATSVEMAVGPKRWTLSEPQLQAVTRCVAHLQVDSAASKNLLAKEAVAEQRAAEAQAAAVAARRARMDRIRPEIEEMIEKARKAASRFPKNREDLRDRARWRVFDADLPKIVSKYGMDKRETGDLMKEYPELRKRMSIR